MKRFFAGLMSTALMCSLAFTGLSSMALTYVDPEIFQMVRGDELTGSDTIKVGRDYGTITSAKSSENGIVRVGKAGSGGVELTAIKEGTATLTIKSYTTDVDGSMTNHETIMTIQVVSEQQADSQLGSDAEFVLNYKSKIIDYSEGYYQIVRCSTTDSNVATGTRAVHNGLEYPQIVAGQKKGECVVSIFYRVAGKSGEQERKINVTVLAPGSSSSKALSVQQAPPSSSTDTSNTSSQTTTNSNTNSSITVPVKVGEKTNMEEQFSTITNIQIEDDSVASAVTTGATGSMSLAVTGKSAGTTKITFNAFTAGKADAEMYTLNVVVSGTTNSNTTTNNNTDTNTATNDKTEDSSIGTKDSGVYLSVKNYSTKVGKKFYASVYIDGEKIVRKDNAKEWSSLRWVSSDTKVLKVNSQSGLVEAAGKGKAKLICVDKEGTSVSSMTITVE